MTTPQKLRNLISKASPWWGVITRDVRQKTMTRKPNNRRGVWWLAAFVVPLFPLAWAIHQVRTLPPEAQGGFDVPIFMWLGGIAAGALALIFSVISILRHEARSYFSLITGIPGFVLVVTAVGWFIFIGLKIL